MDRLTIPTATPYRPWEAWEDRPLNSERVGRYRTLTGARSGMRNGSIGRTLTIVDPQGRIADIWEDGHKVA